MSNGDFKCLTKMMTPRSKYYNYFYVEEGKATCKACQMIFSYSSRVGTNSLRNHLRNKHSEIFQELDRLTQQSDSIDVKPSISRLAELEDTLNLIPPGKKCAKKRKIANAYNKEFPFDLCALGISTTHSTPIQSMHQPDSSSSDSLYPALLEAMVGNDDPATKQDVETIARNLSGVDDGLFYLKTMSEIVKKWPVSNARMFMQMLVKQAMDEDNKMRFEMNK